MNERTTTTFFRIDEGFKNLIPPLTTEERSTLEKECVDYGIRDALVIADYAGSQGLVLIDGHNRYEISQKHNLSFKTERLSFESRADAEAWVIRNQLGRRNIPNYVRAELALKLKPVIAEKAKENQANHTEQGYQKSDKPVTTAKELAKVAGVSHDTIHKVEKIQKEAPEKTKEALRRGELSINAVYSGIVAAENETKRQEAARELREAKHRVEDFGDSKVVSIGEAKQNSDDKKLIFKEFMNEVQKANEALRHVSYRLDLEIDQAVSFAAIKAADKVKQIELQNELNHGLRTMLHIQKVIEEAINEK